ncbi:MAG: TAXI family TRAP transporter solute-binding subunit, partial [Peptococcaceae bacterium]|nr:TAXI family TRAP transporter solute-binding subunit [Peptococcaceae bacterium]
TALAKQFPFYFPIEIPANTYRGQTAPIPTAAVINLLIVRRDLPDTLVYNMTKAIFDNLETLGNAHASARLISLDRIRNGMPIPVHPGAERFFREKGK